MPIRIGKVDLAYVQAVQVAESRLLVEHAILGRAGGALQDLGRAAAIVRIEGLLLGEDALVDLERLRGLEAAARPVAFAADVTSGLDFTDVVVEAIDVTQLAGNRRRYAYALRLREHVEDPEPPAAGLSVVDAAVGADAAAFAAEAVAAGDVLKDVSTLGDALAKAPGILDRLSSGDIAGALAATGGALGGTALAGVVDALGLGKDGALGFLAGVELKDLRDLYEAVKDPSKLPGLLAANSGLLARLGAGDLADALVAQLENIAGPELAGIIEAIAQDPAKLVATIERLRSAGSLGDVIAALAAGGIDLPGLLGDLGVDLGAAAALIDGIAGAADFLAAIGRLGDAAAAVAADVRAFDPFAALRAIAEARP